MLLREKASSRRSCRRDATYHMLSLSLTGARLYEPELPYEYEVARRWWELPRSICLPLQQGGWCQVLFAGRAAGTAGPDVRDAVMRFFSVPDPALEELKEVERVVGDVEFHVRASDWRAHAHHSDPAYNNVRLHIVLICDDAQPTRRQDGRVIPTCSLADVPLGRKLVSLPIIDEKAWPCQQLSSQQRDKLLRRAGLLRFEAKSHRFLEELHIMGSDQFQGLDAYDACLFLALAEALGYGRDRVTFRALGLRLLLGRGEIAEPLGRSLCPQPIDLTRLHVLMNLLARWRSVGIWRTLRNCLWPARRAEDYQYILASLRTCFATLGLSQARTDILLCNVVLPFAAAIALLEHNEALAERGRTLYLQHPGLPSNQITRSMCAQLQLSREPRGSCLQQGLHYIYQQNCREKHCHSCIIGSQRI
ncbi:DUF2851 family protein [Dictyobacter formicarum]|uniref:DUF2851 family protein n=1 Tax=Dictyobacter formicarum TaxID=2778368 RepID=A0ABQ3VVL1_9CHLR|nr:DUF2851 family protein [Dictyobacter formicarum]GHO89603.1 hypothetical protein KSZ_76090 [Dictyobacter formicarum]